MQLLPTFQFQTPLSNKSRTIYFHSTSVFRQIYRHVCTSICAVVFFPLTLTILPQRWLFGTAITPRDLQELHTGNSNYHHRKIMCTTQKPWVQKISLMLYFCSRK